MPAFGSNRSVESTIGCRAYHNINTTIANTTTVQLNFNSERFDTDSMHDTSCSNDEIQINTAGKYLFIANVRWNSGGGGERYVSIVQSGSSTIGSEVRLGDSSDEQSMIVSAVWDCAECDAFVVEAYQDSGANRTILAISDYSPEFMAIRLGD
jgi:hypothetical protein